MTNLWTLDLNIEFQEPIKQRCLPVQTAIKYLGRRLPFGSRLQNSPNQPNGRRMRASMALEPKSHCDSKRRSRERRKAA